MGARRGEKPHDLLGDGLRLLSGRRIVRPVAGLVNEQDVGVGGVSDLTASEASHGDDGVAGESGLPASVGPETAGNGLNTVPLSDDQAGGDRQRPAEDRVGGVGEDGGGALGIDAVEAIGQ